MNEQQASLAPRDRLVNAGRAMLKGIPYIGSSLDQFIFGPLTELRMQRIEQTLREIGEALKATKVAPTVGTEEYANLLEEVLPRLGRAVNEDKRQRFRDLLLNAATIPPGASEWEEAGFASKLLQEVEPAGLSVLAAMGRCRSTCPLGIVSVPVPQVCEGEFDFEKPGEVQHAIPYDWPIVEECCRRLRARRLVDWGSHHGRGGWLGARLTELGRLLIRWVLAEPSASSPRRA